MQASPLSLADIMDETVPQLIELDLSRVDVGALTLMEIYDLCEAAQVEPETMVSAISEGGAVRARVIYAVAWVIMRRRDRSLTFEEVQTYDLQVTGELQATTPQAEKRAKTTVAVAAIAGVSTREAEDMTLNEVKAVTELQERRNRAARRRR